MFLPTLAENLVNHGIQEFPISPATRQAPNNRLIIKNGRVVFATNLGLIKRALNPPDDRLETFCRECGIDPQALRRAISHVAPLRDRAVHRHDILPTEVTEIRQDWLGQGNGGIFSLVVSDQFPPPGTFRRQQR